MNKHQTGAQSDPAKPRSGHISFRAEPELKRQIAVMAAEHYTSESHIIRLLLDKSLKAEGYRKDDERLYAMVKEAVQEVMKPHVERLASISSKATQIDAACFFLLLYIGRIFDAQSGGDTMDIIAARARKLGIQYLQHKGDVDEFISRANQNMRDEL